MSREAGPEEQRPPAAKRRRLLDGLLEAVHGQHGSAAQHTPTEEEQDAELPLPSDVELAILFLRQECFKQLALQQATHSSSGSARIATSQLDNLPPLVLVSQLHSMIHDKRKVEPEVESLRQRNVIRLFKLPTGADEHGLLLTEDYMRLVQQAAQQTTQQLHSTAMTLHRHDTEPLTDTHARTNTATTGCSGRLQVAVAEAFCHHVIPNHKEVSISQARLLALLQLPQHSRAQQGNNAGTSVSSAWLQPQGAGMAVHASHAGPLQQLPARSSLQFQSQATQGQPQHGQQQQHLPARTSVHLLSTHAQHQQQQRQQACVETPQQLASPLAGLPTQHNAHSAQQQVDGSGGPKRTPIRRVVKLLRSPSAPTAATAAAATASNSASPDSLHLTSQQQAHISTLNLHCTSQQQVAVGASATQPRAAAGTSDQPGAGSHRDGSVAGGMAIALPHEQQVLQGHTEQDVGVQPLAGVPANDQLTVLLQLGVIARHPADDNAYMFCCPALGPIIKSILAGRKELLAFISRKPHKEVAERALLGDGCSKPEGHANSTGARKSRVVHENEGGFLKPLVLEFPGDAQAGPTQGNGRSQRSQTAALTTNSISAVAKSPPAPKPGVRLRQSILGVQYHLKDLLGRGDLLRIHSPAGVMVKLSSRHVN